MMSSSPAPRVGYVLRKFPVLSETFILNEILALEALGVPLHIFSLARPNMARFHEDLPKIRATVTYLPDLCDRRKLMRYNREAARRYRGRYARTLARVLSSGHPSLLWRFLQAGYIAHKARKLRLRHLHAHFANRATTVAHLAQSISGVSYSFTAHAVDIFTRRVNRKVLARKVAKARFVSTVSEFNLAFLEDLMNGDKGRIVKVYNGIDLSRFAPNGQPSSAPFTILSVARLVEKKGLPVLIEACRLLRDRGHEFQCWIVGMGRMYARLNGMIEGWGLRDQVHLLGALSHQEVLERYRSARLFVLPCRVGSDGNRDGLPVSIVEALACGLPVVATPVTGIPEVVRDRYNGRVVPEGDASALAEAIESMICDSRLYARVQSNARPSVSSTFDRRRTAAVLQNLLQEATGGPS
ncbi:MAG: glycosyltransferase family 4 protein [Gemmatimonadetes bacterium]|uniref:Glycosyltransferase family 4 protein n=1 Tax=Candidatus Kutchimonas denitrificans TaxID=3056748 RepID=A0AAE5CDG9_9BACT|nr:glycosyltransferase family 4 protein [Gemmatimonadota bacterium]NIR75749.1 glycosyltransferase family 4 protein [Candidatus Kutchimonas denitrificans]NIS00362.1 glycosyltransferase family 4 protein [Gemmatimonadota bacterium]NIT66021.1 glycosyltransferase family 4 protein [Gemmatimonadota bacterium]NIU53725.1 glycosyltransferase [Gemmatimonadota bacterium]